MHQDLPTEDSTWAHSDIELITSLGAFLGDVSMNQAVMYPDVQWSPDSSYLYFIADGVGIDPVFNIPNPDIFRIRTDGSGITPITKTELLEQWFLLSPTGQDIAYAVGERDVVETGLSMNLSLMTSGGDKITQITFDHSPGSISWSSNGEYLLYTAFLERDEDRSKDRYQLSLYIRADQQSKHIATGALPLIFSWAPDGTEFLYRIYETDDDGCVLFLANVAEPSTPTELPCMSAYDGPYRWRP